MRSLRIDDASPGRTVSGARCGGFLRVACCVLPGLMAPSATADSSTPLLASYYDRHLAICGGDAYEWSNGEQPRRVLRSVVAVGVGRARSFALTRTGQLLTWDRDPAHREVLSEDVRTFAAGDSGVLAIKADGSLWRWSGSGGRWPGRDRAELVRVAGAAKAASVGDGTDYYVTSNGDLYARGNAHRGQYGDGRLEPTEDFVRVATQVVAVGSHTGHALLLTERGEVLGTGGNTHGPLGRHGLGDRAVRWGRIFDDSTGIATGASHSLALRADATLWIWGRNETPEPRGVLTGVTGAAAGADDSVALTRDGVLWQWRAGRQPAKLMDCAP
jgi:hypothetical protein